MTVRGGDKLRRKLREQLRTSADLDDTVIEIGFFSEPEASLAVMHEFGNVRTHLPERPAFRAALMPEDVSRITRAVTLAHGLGSDLARRVAIALFEHIRDSYLAFHSAEPDKQLQGAEGTKMIAHLEARVNGRTVAMGA